MKRLLALLAMLAAGSLLASAVTAAPGEGNQKQNRQGPRGGDPAARFAEADTDEDGKLSLEEFKAMHEKRLEHIKERLGDRFDEERFANRPGPEEIFKRLDTDEDGYLTQEEMRAGRRRGGPRGGPGGGPGGGGFGGGAPAE